MKKVRFSRFEVINGFIKIYRCYRSVLCNDKQLTEDREIYMNQLRACDKMRDNWLMTWKNRAFRVEDEEFLDWAFISVNMAVEDLKNKKQLSVEESSQV